MLLSFMKNADAQVSLLQARTNFLAMESDECKALELSSKFEKSPPSEALLSAYYGASTAAAPACLGSPLDKLKYFRKGKALLDKAVTLEPTHVEIRFLRFATQTKAPSFLGYSGNIDEDKKVILTNFATYSKSKGNTVMTKQIANFLIASGKLSAGEKASLIASVN